MTRNNYTIPNFSTSPYVIPDATDTDAGMMSRADKAKLAALDPGVVTITNISPLSVVAGSNDVITVTGTNFLGGDLSNTTVNGHPIVITIVDNQHFTFLSLSTLQSGYVRIGSFVVSPQPITVHPTDKYGLVIAADNPVLWWRLNQTPFGIQANILNPSVYQGQVQGGPAVVAPLVVSDAVSPAGEPLGNASSAITQPGSPAFSYPGATGVSFEFWVKPLDGAVDDTFDFGTGLRDSGFGGNPGIAANIDIVAGVPQPFTAILVGADEVEGPPLSTAALAFGVGHHVVYTYDDTANQGRIYLNGALVAGPIAMRPGAGFYTGSQAPSVGFASSTWMGVLSEYAVYSYTLSAGRVAAHYAAGL